MSSILITPTPYYCTPPYIVDILRTATNTVLLRTSNLTSPLLFYYTLQEKIK